MQPSAAESRIDIERVNQLIQRVFSARLALSCAQSLAHGLAAERFRRGLDELDLLVSELRNVMFDKSGIALSTETPSGRNDPGAPEGTGAGEGGLLRQTHRVLATAADALDSLWSTAVADRTAAPGADGRIAQAALFVHRARTFVRPSDRGSHPRKDTSSLRRPSSELSHSGASTARVPSAGDGSPGR